MPKTEEYEDKRGENRIRHTADNGKVTYSSSEGYKNKEDMRETAINTCIEILEYYLDNTTLSNSQLEKIENLGDQASYLIEL